jgi:rare lipoprotein A
MWGWGRPGGVARCLALALVVGTGCALRRGPTMPPVVDGVQLGVASWYGPGFDGNRTASGEVFDQHALTAAHPSLPLGTRVMVTHLVRRRSVEVRINDRGPFVDGRVIDLSYAAARAIDMVGTGTAPVRLEVLAEGSATPRPPPASPPAPPPARPVPARAQDPPPAASYMVQVAALGDPGRAEHLRQVLARRFPEAFVSAFAGATGRSYRVRLGPYPLHGLAVRRAASVERLGYSATVIEEASR